jgi:protein-tyrosine phosphatase
MKRSTKVCVLAPLVAAGLAIAVILAHARAPVAGKGIENPTCELVRPGVYTINFQSAADAGPVEVFASSRPDRIDSAKPVATMRRAPADVTVPAPSGRIYFHLRSPSGATRVVAVRRLPLEGAKNFRDLGGYRSADGRYVRWGLVYRSGYLADLTKSDYAYLNTLGIRLVCDVRAEGERLRSPTQWTGRPPEFLSVPIGPNRDGTLTADDLKRRVAALNAPGSGPVSGYDFAIKNAPQYGKILQRIAAGDLPAVEHCTSGKDRTGVFSAILLTILDVPRDTVIQDYLLTERYLLAPDSLESTRAQLQKIFGLPEPLDDATVKAIMTVRPETLAATLDAITTTYGSFDTYFRDALHLSDADRALIRQRLLEP